MSASASGSLAEKPLAHLVVYVLERRLTGSLELAKTDGSQAATVVFCGGQVARVKTSASVAFLGALLYELGVIDSGELDASLLALSKGNKLHGQILLERGSITEAQLAGALHEQTLRKVTHLFGFGQEATYTYHDDVDLIPSWGPLEPSLVDPTPALWRGVRDHPDVEQVRRIIGGLGSQRLRLTSAASIDRFRFLPDEQVVVESLGIKAMTVGELRALGVVPPKTMALLLYTLLITKQVELLEAAPPVAETSRSGTHRLAVPNPRIVGASSSPAVGAAGRPPVSIPASHPPSIPASAESTGRARFIRERARAIQHEDYFQRLGVARDATKEQIDREFAMLSSLWQPASLPPELEAVREDCARVFFALADAYETLTDPRKRGLYVDKLLLGQTLRYEPAADLAASGGKTPFEGAQRSLAAGDPERAERLAYAAHKAQPNEAAPLALVAWLEAQRPTNRSADATRVRIAMLDRAVLLDSDCAIALYYRAQLHARVENHRAAMSDLTRVVALEPNNIDAMRQLRIYHMRVRNGSVSMRAVRPPGATSAVLTRPSAPASGSTSSGSQPRMPAVGERKKP